MGKEVLIIFVAYTLGCITSGYYLTLFRIDQDIREYGSGSVGATNVSRVLGQSGFAITFLGDLLKGALAMGLALVFGLSPLGLALTLLAVVVGHIWPIQLKFQGGKGLSTALGAMLVFDPILTLFMILLLGIIWVILKQFTLSAPLVVLAWPIAATIKGHSSLIIGTIVILVLILLIAHRRNIEVIVMKIKR